MIRRLVLVAALVVFGATAAGFATGAGGSHAIVSDEEAVTVTFDVDAEADDLSAQTVPAQRGRAAGNGTLAEPMADGPPLGTNETGDGRPDDATDDESDAPGEPGGPVATDADDTPVPTGPSDSNGSSAPDSDTGVDGATPTATPSEPGGPDDADTDEPADTTDATRPGPDAADLDDEGS